MKKLRVARRQRLRYVRVPIFTEEYAIHVYSGAPAAIQRAAEARVRRHDCTLVTNFADKLRGLAWNALPEHNPIIGVRGDLADIDLLATLAHEASHAMGYIVDCTGLDDGRGEFRAHGISAVVRVAGPKLLKGRRR